MNWIQTVAQSPRRTPVKLYLWQRRQVAFPGCQVFFCTDGCQLVFGDWEKIAPVLQACKEDIIHYEAECSCRNSALSLLDIKNLPARVEPGAIIRENAVIGENAVILMGAIINVGAQVGRNTMVDMGAVLGGGAQVGANCHIGAGAVVAGVLEPASAQPVVIEDGVLIGANAVVLEGCHIGANAVVAAGAVVTASVPEKGVVAGAPARIVKFRDKTTDRKTALVEALRGPATGHSAHPAQYPGKGSQ